MSGCSLEKVRASKCSRVSFRDLVGSLSGGVDDLETFGIEVAIFGVSLKFFQESEEFSGRFLGVSSSIEWLGELPTVWNFLVIVSICYCDLLLYHAF